MSGYVGRDDYIIGEARGRRVLHLGCVGETDGSTEHRSGAFPGSLHARLMEVADSVTGVDSSAAVVAGWRDTHGVDNIAVGDVEHLGALSLDGGFDLVVASDIIEHLSRPGSLLEGIRSVCAPGTRLIVTTPNAFGLLNYVRFLRGTFRDGDEHVVTFNPVNLVLLLERHHVEILDVKTCHQSFAATRGLSFRIGRRIFERIPKLGGTLLVLATV